MSAQQSSTAQRLAPAMLNQLARYAPALALIEADPGGTCILEVGSGSEGIARFASPRWQITVCDRDFSDYGSVEAGEMERSDLTRVEGDVTRLPFEDRSFDVVLALDLLEHVPPVSRPAALSELARVAAGRLIVACPCGEPALRSDQRLARFYRLQGRRPPQWLAEHLGNGFPQVEELQDALSVHGRVTCFPNERLGMHQAVSMLEGVRGVARATVWLARLLEPGMYARAQGRASVAGSILDALRGWDRSPAYRQFLVLDRAGPDQR